MLNNLPAWFHLVRLCDVSSRWSKKRSIADDVLILHEAAEALGAHYMSAYRYVHLGLLDAAKRGGVWKVERSSIAAF